MAKGMPINTKYWVPSLASNHLPKKIKAKSGTAMRKANSSAMFANCKKSVLFEFLLGSKELLSIFKIILGYEAEKSRVLILARVDKSFFKIYNEHF